MWEFPSFYISHAHSDVMLIHSSPSTELYAKKFGYLVCWQPLFIDNSIKCCSNGETWCRTTLFARVCRLSAYMQAYLTVTAVFLAYDLASAPYLGVHTFRSWPRLNELSHKLNVIGLATIVRMILPTNYICEQYLHMTKTPKIINVYARRRVSTKVSA